MRTLQIFTYLGAILTYLIEIPGLVALEPTIKKNFFKYSMHKEWMQMNMDILKGSKWTPLPLKVKR